SPKAYTYSVLQSVADKIPPQCVNFSYGHMEFFSPMFPQKYPNNVDCVHTIEAQPGFEIHLDFREKFDIEEAESGDCKFDFLEVREGPFAYSLPSNKYCGNKFPPLLVSSTRFMWLRFKSDDNEQKGGFKGVYSYIKKKDNGEYNAEKERMFVCRHVINNPSGTLTSSTMSTLVTGNVDCTWEIQGPPKSKVVVHPVSLLATVVAFNLSLKCNGEKNCPSGSDEEDCPGMNDDTDSAPVPMYIIIGGAVGGVVLTAILLTAIIVACNASKNKRNRRQKEKELAIEQEKMKDKNIEMTSTTSTLSSKKGACPPGYYSLPRPQGGRSGSVKDSIHRNSLTNSLQSPSEGEYGDQSVMIRERHDIPPQTEIDGTYGWGGYGWKQSPTDPRSPSSLSENLAKLAKYNMPQKTFQYTGNPDTKLYYPEHKYDMNPEQRIMLNKDFKMKYGSPTEKESPSHDEQNLKKQFKLKSQHPDITRDLEVKNLRTCI
ncbi:hypothetical protein FSP39_017746, partial [Pinctada imbricata]